MPYTTFTLKHYHTFLDSRPTHFLGNDNSFMKTTQISVSLEPSYYKNMLRPSSRLQGPTTQDFKSLKHTLHYIKGTQDYKIYLRCIAV